jgi:hypothetical protein
MPAAFSQPAQNLCSSRNTYCQDCQLGARLTHCGKSSNQKTQHYHMSTMLHIGPCRVRVSSSTGRTHVRWTAHDPDTPSQKSRQPCGKIDRCTSSHLVRAATNHLALPVCVGHCQLQHRHWPNCSPHWEEIHHHHHHNQSTQVHHSLQQTPCQLLA